MSETPIGKPLVEIYSRFTIEGLFWLLSNNSTDFRIAFRRADQVHCVQPIRLFKGSAINAAIATMSGPQPARAQIAFSVSCQQGFTERSCWGGLKLSPTPEDKIVNARLVYRTFKYLRAYAYGRSILVEACGDGSWQFWAIRNGFSAYKTWWRLLGKVTSEAGIACEIFPSKDGLGMPVPGSWDPHTGRLSRIVFADLTAIFPEPAYSAFDSAALPISASPVVAPNANP